MTYKIKSVGVAKGQLQADKSYQYTCGNCAGIGYIKNNKLCVYCYNGDYAKITEELKTARGQRYYALLKSALKIAGKAIHDTTLEYKALNENKITMPMMGHLSFYFNINLKALGEWLEEVRLIPTGATERIYETTFTMPDGTKKRFKVADAIQHGHSWYEDKFGKKAELWRKD